jgi:predicted ABC-type transport system involved in lysophospholipase L1 biosynthesis ATPase subunit
MYHSQWEMANSSSLTAVVVAVSQPCLVLLSGLDQPTNGRIFLDNTDITNMTEDDLAPVRNGVIGFVFQSFHLVPSLTALENIMFPAELRKDQKADQKAETLLGRVGLHDRPITFLISFLVERNNVWPSAGP